MSIGTGRVALVTGASAGMTNGAYGQCDRKRGWLPRQRASRAGVRGRTGPDPRSAAVTFATREHYVIRLILRICLSKIRAGTRRRSMLTRPAPEPAVYRSFGLGSVSAATITLAITAGPGDRDALPHGAGRRKVIRDLAGSQMAQCRTPALGSHCGQWLLGVPQRGRPVRRVVQRRLTHATQRARDSRSVPA